MLKKKSEIWLRVYGFVPLTPYERIIAMYDLADKRLAKLVNEYNEYITHLKNVCKKIEG